MVNNQNFNIEINKKPIMTTGPHIAAGYGVLLCIYEMRNKQSVMRYQLAHLMFLSYIMWPLAMSLGYRRADRILSTH